MAKQDYENWKEQFGRYRRVVLSETDDPVHGERGKKRLTGAGAPWAHEFFRNYAKKHKLKINTQKDFDNLWDRIRDEYNAAWNYTDYGWISWNFFDGILPSKE